MLLRNIFPRLYKKACELLQNSTNPIDIITWRLLSRKEIIVLPFIQLNKKDFSALKNDFQDETQKVLPAHYPPSKYTTKQLDQTWLAKICDNRIYVRYYLKNVQQLKKILVHEANHFLNNSQDHYDTPEQVFQEEFRANIAEKMSNNIPLTRFRLKKMAQKVSKTYKTPLPSTLEVPQGIYYDEDALNEVKYARSAK